MSTSSQEEPKRLTVTLGRGQREQLEAIASANGAPLAYVVRYALEDFLRRQADPQLRLDFGAPENAPS